ncbi:hypothetical protein bcgnr5379_61240 [Bacillus cereus]
MHRRINHIYWRAQCAKSAPISITIIKAMKSNNKKTLKLT